MRLFVREKTQTENQVRGISGKQQRTKERRETPLYQCSTGIRKLGLSLAFVAAVEMSEYAVGNGLSDAV
jgi:hypothetical protein